MATDNINQVGKSIRKIKENAEYSSKRVNLNKRIERTRDVFDVAIPFEMEFRTDSNHDQVYLDLKFNKPPPRKGCTADCFSNKCESFIYTDHIDHLVQLQAVYIAGTVRVFRNQTLLTTVNYVETSPENGQVYVQTSGEDEEITVCYVTGDCQPKPFDASQPLHYFFGTFTFSTDGAGSSYGPGYGQTIFADCNRINIYTPSGSQWKYAAGIILVNIDYAPEWGLGIVGLGPGDGLVHAWNENLHINKPAPPWILGQSGTTTIGPSYVGTWGFAAKAAAGLHVPHTANVTFWVDPIDWVVPSPDSGQQVINDRPIATGNNIFSTSFPFVLGTLHVYVNSIEVPITESSNQTFIFVTNPSATDTLSCTYEAL